MCVSNGAAQRMDEMKRDLNEVAGSSLENNEIISLSLEDSEIIESALEHNKRSTPRHREAESASIELSTVKLRGIKEPRHNRFVIYLEKRD